MSGRSSDTIFHDEVEVGNTIKIAARGLTPNHLHFPTRVYARGVSGILESYRHTAEGRTVIMVLESGHRVEITVDFLQEIEVTHL